jgi:CubicO group peptidase (beta-lactamase class C family)
MSGAVATMAFLSVGTQAQASPAMPTQARLAQITTSSQAQYRVPALGTAVVVNGNIRFAVAGVRKQGAATPVTSKDKFHLGSCTKSMTATLAALLVEEGKLKWGTTLAQVFPELAATMQPAYRRVTILQLLQHRGGFTDETFPTKLPINYWQASTLPLRQQRLKYLQHVLRELPATAPGGKMLYSNRGYMVVGAMLERLTKRSWEQLMRERLFRPLGMTSASFGPTSLNGSRVDQPWPHLRQNGRLVAISPAEKPDNPPLLGPAGTVHCSMEDWAKYARFHLRAARGQEKRLSAKTCHTLHRAPPGSQYAAGWIVTNRPWGGGDVLMHNGSNTLNYAVIWLAPKRNFAALETTNVGDGFEVCDAAASLLIQEVQKEP